MKITPLKIEYQKEAKKLLKDLGVSREGINILSPKSIFAAFKIEGISSWEANIIKQHLLSVGSDSAINRDALTKKIKTDTFIFGNLTQLRKLCDRLKTQPFNLKEVSQTVSLYLNNLFKDDFSFRARNKTLKIKRPLICGIVNITKDSFSGDGLLIKINPSTSLRIDPECNRRVKNQKPKIKNLVLQKVEKMVKEGAKIIDVGGESSRPYSLPIKEEEEIRRVIPALKAIRKEFKDILISVDTYKYKVAKEAVSCGVDIINDITALRHSSGIATLVKRYKLGCILMHMKGMPRSMQLNPRYREVVEEIIDFFKERLEFCERCGIDLEQILIDPGIGFGKRTEDNFKIINQLYKFKIFGRPIFLGLSRKSFIGKALNLDVEQRLAGTIAANVLAVIRGANILRVHDVRQTQEAIKIASSILSN